MVNIERRPDTHKVAEKPAGESVESESHKDADRRVHQQKLVGGAISLRVSSVIATADQVNEVSDQPQKHAESSERQMLETRIRD